MTGLEIDNFFKLDDKRYVLENNLEFINWYNKKLKEGYYSILDIKQMQRLIDFVVFFFEFKYHDNLLRENVYVDKNTEYYKSKDLSLLLDIDELKYRLHHDYLEFLECSYFSHITLRRPKENIWDLSMEIISVDREGIINSYDIESLRENKFIGMESDIKMVTDLLGYYLSNPTNVDYHELEQFVKEHKFKLELRNKVLELIPFAILYSNNSLPIYSYSRVKSFIRMFNREYNLDLDSSQIDKIMNEDYSRDVSILKKQRKKTF